MGFCLIPEYSFSEVIDISQEFLKNQNIRLLMIDLDNTLAAYDEHFPAEDILKWVEGMKSSGITLALVSNSTQVSRVSAFAKMFGVGSTYRARKPSPYSLFGVMESEDIGPDESVLIGDQIFTDVLAANRAEVMSIIVKPRKFTNIFLALRYFAELPIRFFARNKFMG